MPVPISILDLSPIRAGDTPADALHNSLDLAQHAERWGYKRIWIAEHHSIPGVASAATSVVLAYIAGGTSTIRVGSGGIMLPNHAPLVIAEQFGTLDALYPGRIDLGLGRAPGSDMRTAVALRRTLGNRADSFPDDVRELQGYFRGDQPVKAVPGEGQNVPLYILGSSDFGARMAAEMGLPFAFASHFAPDYLMHALNLYRENFRPSEALAKPYAMVAANVVAADSDAEAKRLFTSIQQSFRNLIRNRPGLLPPPVETMEGEWTPAEEAHVNRMTAISAIGDPTSVRDKLNIILDATGADELIAVCHVYEHAARLRSFELLSGIEMPVHANA